MKNIRTVQSAAANLRHPLASGRRFEKRFAYARNGSDIDLPRDKSAWMSDVN
jgi:hypothetical protein